MFKQAPGKPTNKPQKGETIHGEGNDYIPGSILSTDQNNSGLIYPVAPDSSLTVVDSNFTFADTPTADSSFATSYGTTLVESDEATTPQKFC